MYRYIAGLKNSSFIPIIIAFCCMAVFGLGSWSPGVRSNPQGDRLPQVKNETESFQLVSAERTTDSIILRVRNTSVQGITAYSVSWGHIHKFSTKPNKDYRPYGAGTHDYAIGDNVIAPGAIEEIRLSSLAFIDAYAKNSNQEPIINIAAVVFEDGTSEGDFAICSEIKDTRIGEKIQLERINRLVENMLKLPDTDMGSALVRLKIDVSSLSETSEESLSEAGEVGLRYAKQMALHMIEEMESQDQRNASRSSLDARKHLQEMLRQNESRITRYKGKVSQ